MNIKYPSKSERVALVSLLPTECFITEDKSIYMVVSKNYKNTMSVLLICLNDGHCIVGVPDALVEKCEVEIKVV